MVPGAQICVPGTQFWPISARFGPPTGCLAPNWAARGPMLSLIFIMTKGLDDGVERLGWMIASYRTRLLALGFISFKWPKQ